MITEAQRQSSHFKATSPSTASLETRLTSKTLKIWSLFSLSPLFILSLSSLFSPSPRHLLQHPANCPLLLQDDSQVPVSFQALYELPLFLQRR